MAEESQSIDQFKGQSRLPKFAVPKRYDLKLTPDLTACKFTGALGITVDVVATTSFLVLNAADLSVDNDSVRFKAQGSRKVKALAQICLTKKKKLIFFVGLILGATPVGDCYSGGR